MTEAFAVQSTLTAKDELSPVLERVMKMATDLHKSLQAVGNLKVFETLVKGADNVTKSLGTATGSADKFLSALQRTNGATAGGEMAAIAKDVGAVSRALGRAGANAEKFEQNLVSAAGKANDLDPLLTKVKEIADVAKGAATNTKAMGAAIGSGGNAAARAKAKANEETFFGKAMGAQVAGMQLEIVGKDILGGIAETIKPAMGYEHQVELLRVMGVLPQEIADAESAAWKDRVAGSTPTEALQAIGELRSILTSTKEAIEFMPSMLKLQDVGEAVTGHKQEGLAYTTMRALELFGRTINPDTKQMDPERAMHGVDLMTRIMIATHGKINPQELLGFAQQAGPVAARMSDEGLLSMVPIMQAMGSKRAGTALTSLNSQIVGGVMPERVAADWAKMGLLDMAKTHATKMGLRVDQGAVKGEELWKQNPVAWIEQKLIPAMQSHGLNNNQQQDMIMRLMSRQTSQREAAEIARSLVQVNRDVQQMQGNMGSGSYEDFVKNDPAMGLKIFQKELETFEIALGTQILPVLTPALVGLAGALKSMTTWGRENPAIVKGILAFITFLGVVAMVAGGIIMFVGAIMLMAGILGGGVVAVIIAVAVAIGAFVASLFYVDWGAVLGSVADFFVGLWQTIKSGSARAWAAVSGFFSWLWAKIVAGFHSAVAWVVDGVTAYFRALGMIPHLLVLIGQRIWQAVAEFGTKLWDGFKTMLTNLINSIVGFLKSALASMQAALGLPTAPAAGAAKAAKSISDGFGMHDAAKAWTASKGLMDGGPTIQGNPSPAAAGGFGPTAARAAAMNGQDGAAAAGAAGPIQVQTAGGDLHLDGEKIGAWVVKFIGNQTGGPNTGPSAHDPFASYTPPGMAVFGSGF